MMKKTTHRHWLAFARKFVLAGILFYLLLMLLGRKREACIVITVVLGFYLVGALLLGRCPHCGRMFPIRMPADSKQCPLCRHGLD